MAKGEDLQPRGCGFKSGQQTTDTRWNVSKARYYIEEIK